MTRKTRTHDETLTANGLGDLATVVGRILAYWRRATPTDMESGARWYGEDSQVILAALVGAGARSREHAAAVVSHMSPRTTWARNVAGAMLLVSDGPDAAKAMGCMAAGVDRANKALHSDAPLDTFGGPKTKRFARNLLGDRESVTVDVWAARIAMGDRPTAEINMLLGRVGVYDAIEAAYQEAAYRMRVDPTTMQATTWIVARNGRAA